MASLLIADLEEDVVETLRRRAERKGSTVENEAREILAQAVRRDPAEFARWLRRFQAEQAPDLGPGSTELLRRDRARGG